MKPETVIGWHRRGFVRFWARRAAQQMIEAVAPDVVAERVIRDRDGIFGAVFDERLTSNRGCAPLLRSSC